MTQPIPLSHSTFTPDGSNIWQGTPIAITSATDMIVACVNIYFAATSVTLSTTPGGSSVASFTNVVHYNDGGGNRGESVWMLQADDMPAPGNYYVSVGGSLGGYGGAIVSLWQHGPQTTPFGTAVTVDNDDGNPLSITVPSVSDNSVVFLVSAQGGSNYPTTPLGTGQVSLGDQVGGPLPVISASYLLVGTGGSITVSNNEHYARSLAIAMNPGTAAAPAVPAKLGILTQPTTATTHHSFTITVAVQEVGGATVTGNTDTVTLAPSGTGTASLLGSLSVSAVAGVATFTLTAAKNTEDASITFTATSGSLTAAATTPITLKVQSLDVAVS